MKRVIFSISILLLVFSSLKSQDKPVTNLVNNVKFFNSKTIHGSARSIALGGVESALGASVQSTVVNPAGIGLYRRSDYSITTAVNSGNIKSSGNNLVLAPISNDNVMKFSATSLGVVLNNEVEDGIVKSSSFAVTYNKLADYDYSMEYEGRVSSGGRRVSFFENFGNPRQGDLWGTDVYDPLNGSLVTNDVSALVYYGFVIRPLDIMDPNQTDYIVDHPRETSVIYESVESSGSKNSWDFAYGLNLDDKLFLGLSIGLGVITQRLERRYEEVVAPYPGDGLIGFEMRQTITNRGYGLNLKLGAIYRLNDQVRLSYSFHSATNYQMTEEYSASIQTLFDSLGTITYFASAQTTGINTEYEYREPWKMNIGGAFFFLDKKGFLSTELEYQSFSLSNLSGGTVNWSEENKAISQRYKGVFNYKLGGEYRKGKGRYRVGIAVFGNPDKDQKFNRYMLSLGAGVKWRQFYIDFGTAYENHQFEFSPYELQNGRQPKLSNKLNRMHFSLTLGFTFKGDED